MEDAEEMATKVVDVDALRTQLLRRQLHIQYRYLYRPKQNVFDYDHKVVADKMITLCEKLVHHVGTK